MFRLCIKVDRIKIENLTPILEAAPVDLDPDCRTPVSGGICDLLLYIWRVLNGIVLLFYVLIYKNFLRKYDPKCMYLQTLSLFEGIRFRHNDCSQSQSLNIDINAGG